MVMELQLAFWNSEPGLNEDFRRSLELFYWRIPAVSDDVHPMLMDRDINRILNTAADRGDREWLCVIRVGAVFPDQERIVYLINKAIDTDGGQKPYMASEGAFLLDLWHYRGRGRPKYADIAFDVMPKGLREEIVYACPEDGLDRLNRNLETLFELEDMENPSQRRLLGYLFNKRLRFNPMFKGSGVNLSERDYGVFLFNTEDLLADPSWRLPPGRLVDTYAGPCAGFLDAAILFTLGFHETTKLVYFDINERALEVRQRLLRDFDGEFENLPAFMEDLVKTYPQHTPFYRGNVASKLKELLHVFGNGDNFRETWRRMRALPAEFHKVNLITGYSTILEKMDPSKTNIFTVSDIFTGQNELTYGRSKIQAHYRGMREAAASRRAIVTGKTDDGRPFIGR
jgi:hypothetical protein